MVCSTWHIVYVGSKVPETKTFRILMFMWSFGPEALLLNRGPGDPSATGASMKQRLLWVFDKPNNRTSQLWQLTLSSLIATQKRHPLIFANPGIQPCRRSSMGPTLDSSWPSAADRLRPQTTVIQGVHLPICWPKSIPIPS